MSARGYTVENTTFVRADATCVIVCNFNNGRLVQLFYDIDPYYKGYLGRVGVWKIKQLKK